MGDRRKTITYLGFAVFISFSLISLWVLFKLNSLEQGIINIVDVYGYAAILALAFITDMIMQPIGPDVPLVAGILIGLSPLGSLIFAFAGSMAATALGYFLGRVYGEEGFLKFYGYNRYQKWKRRYDKYGRMIIVLAALTPLPYVPICWLSGIFRMKLPEFLILALGARALRLIGVTYLALMIMTM